MPGAEEPRWGTPLAAGSWQCPGPRPSLTMTATPENMTAETSCQTLRAREDRGHGVSTGVIPPLILRKVFLAACSVISLHPPSLYAQGGHKPPVGGLCSPHPASSSLSMQTGLAGERCEIPPTPKQRREVTLPRAGSPQSHKRPGAPPAPRSPYGPLHLLWDKSLRVSG